MRSLCKFSKVLILILVLSSMSVAGTQFDLITLRDVSTGKSFSVSSMVGSPVIIYVFDPSCRPSCREDLRILDEMLQRFALQKLKIVGVSVDPFPINELKNIVSVQGLDFPITVGALKLSDWLVLTGTERLPVTVILDSKASLYLVYSGNLVYEELRNSLRELTAGL